MEKDQDRFWNLLQPEHLKARAFCRKLAGGRDDGDDLYQDALVRAYARLGDLRQESAFRPWLYRIMVNTFKNRVRRTHREVELTDELIDRTVGEDPSGLYAARRRLAVAFAELDSVEQALVTLTDLQGWPNAETAEVFGFSVGAVKVRLHRARRKMRRVLQNSAPAAGEQVTRPETEGDVCVADSLGDS